MTRRLGTLAGACCALAAFTPAHAADAPPTPATAVATPTTAVATPAANANAPAAESGPPPTAQGAAPPDAVTPPLMPDLPPLGDSSAPMTPGSQPGANPGSTPPAVPPSLPSASGAPLAPGAPALPVSPQDASDGTTLAGASEAHLSARFAVYHPSTQLFEGRGDVVVDYQDVHMTGDEGFADLKTRDVTMKGHVYLKSGVRLVHADELTFNLRTKTWRLGGGQGSFLPPQLLSPLYFHGRNVSGFPGLVSGGPADVTTCDLDEPHYHIEGKRITIIPDRRAVINHATLYIKGRPVLKLRRLVIPLQRTNTNIIPTAGQNTIEGYFLKTAYYYPSKNGQVGIARFDTMSKQGIGLGVDQGYKFGQNAAGKIVLYSVVAGALSGKNLTGSLEHLQRLGSYQARLRSDIRNNSYQFSPNSKSASHNLDITRTTTNGSTALGFRSDTTESGFGSSGRQSYSLEQSQKWGLTASRVKLELFDTTSTNFSDRELNSQVNLDRRLPEWDLGFNYTKRTQLQSTNPGFFSSLDKLPELTFATSRRRIKGGFLSALPGTFGLSVGEYHEEPGDVTSQRVLVELGVDNHRSKFGKSTLDVSGRFTQAVYRSDSAQYLVNTNANWRTPFSKHNELSLRYLLYSPKGYTPFRFDTIGKYNLLTMDYVHKEKALQVAVGSGRDFRGGPFGWQDGRVRLRYTPSRRLQLGAASAYDFNGHHWRDVVNDTRIRFGYQGFLNVGARYTPLTKKVASLRWNLFTPLGRKYSLQTFGGWNGFTKQYDYRALRLNWEHHDFRASLAYVEQVGYRSEKGFRLMVHLRALPMNEEIATGQFGQSLNTTEVGEIF